MQTCRQTIDNCRAYGSTKAEKGSRQEEMCGHHVTAWFSYSSGPDQNMLNGKEAHTFIQRRIPESARLQAWPLIRDGMAGRVVTC